jgi:hypothetical protein
MRSVIGASPPAPHFGSGCVAELQ